MKTKMIIKDQKGGALIEFAIALIFLVPLAFGIIEFGLLVYNKHIIANASREGARAGIVQDSVNDKSDAQIKAIVNLYCFGVEQNGLCPNSRLIDFDSNICELPDEYIVLSNRTGSNFGDDFSVFVRYDYGFLVPGLFNMGTTTTITAETLMKMEQALGS